ncbi:hypothetical protein MMC13_001619 [Lambiella insularis]|nr:hypothetical protein [Lambiella insularis]
MGKYSNEAEDEIRQRLLDDRQCSVVEHRNIVFMRKHNPTAVLDAASRVERIVKPQHEPTYSHVLTPTPAMLFRFSALTFNAHRIHLDRQYCLATEGHRNLLVHGPLSLILMIELLRRYLSREGSHVLSAGLREKEQITEIEYRNLAPLYADEPMRVCVRRKKEGEWEVWIEGRDGGYAVKGVAKTSMKDIFEEKHLTLATTGSVQSS